MISVISIVNVKYLNSELNIECAKKDGELVVNTFENLLKDEFNSYASGIYIDVESYQLKYLLDVHLKSQNNGDIVIIYFGCHGKLESGEKFYLILSDAIGEKYTGYFAISELYELCYRYANINFLLIFDCCFSGSVLSLANKQYIENESNITVITSSSYYERTKYTALGSDFAFCLCKALKNLDGREENITVSNIVKEIKINNGECFTNISEGKEDFTILSRKKKFEIYDNKFINTFIERLNNCVAVREMMWYSINDLPDIVKKKIFEKYFEAGCTEASWLVRRAMGTILSNMGSEVNEKIVNRFLQSFNWMEKCVGIVAISKTISEEKAQYLKNIICDENSNIDLIWLSDLYLSDSNYYDIQVTLRSRLSKSVWGLIEIWDRYSEKYGEEKLSNIIYEIVTEKDLIKSLHKEIDLREKTIKGSLEYFIYNSKRRGRTVALEKKWLLSLLYGNWRGRVECDLKEYFSNSNKEKIVRELEEAKNIPSVERRVSIFEYFENEPKYFEMYKEYIKWGLRDEHPWVRRIAILCFKKYPAEIETSFGDLINTEMYSETFAMIINAASIKSDINYREYIDGYKWTDCEKEAILEAVYKENKRKYM